MLIIKTAVLLTNRDVHPKIFHNYHKSSKSQLRELSQIIHGLFLFLMSLPTMLHDFVWLFGWKKNQTQKNTKEKKTWNTNLKSNYKNYQSITATMQKVEIKKLKSQKS